MFSFNDESITRSSSLNYNTYVTTYLPFVNNYFGYPKTKVFFYRLFLETVYKISFDAFWDGNYN